MERTVKILHCGDLHLDSPFSRLPLEKSERRRTELRETFLQVMRMVREEKIPLVLISGDLFDNDYATGTTAEILRREFAASADTQFFISPGNHDPYGDASPWATHLWPDQVRIFTGKPEAVTLPELGCRVWGGAFTAEACEDPLPKVPDSGLLEIGVFHGDPLHSGPHGALHQGGAGGIRH